MKKIFKYKKFILMIIIVLSVLFGVFLFNKLSDENVEFIIKSANSMNYVSIKTLLIHFLLLTVSFLLSFFGIGIIILILYLFFEGIVIGFMGSFFIYLYHLKGVIYFSLYILIFKALLIFLLIILTIKFYKLFKTMIKYLKKENHDITKTVINSIIIITSILIYDVSLLLFGTKILNTFSFLLK